MPNTVSPRFKSRSVAIAALMMFGVAGQASADVIGLSYTTISSGTSGSGTQTALTVPASHTFGNSLGALSTPVFTTGTGQSYEFYDNYIFSISSASANSLTSSINLGAFLGLDSFQVRLYELGSNPTLPVLGSPAGGTLIESWSMPINFSPGMTGLLSVIPEHVLNSGAYVLEVRGNVSGLAGGSYSGVLNLSTVPLPAAAWLLLSALSGLGLLRRSSAQKSTTNN
jgi:hypothetical protein